MQERQKRLSEDLTLLAVLFFSSSENRVQLRGVLFVGLGEFGGDGRKEEVEVVRCEEPERVLGLCGFLEVLSKIGSGLAPHVI